jgi:Uncharacterised nucleotidyltransferase
MRPEEELLVLCAAPPRSRFNPARIRELAAQPLDWTFLQDSADHHRLTPLLYWALQSTQPSLVPERLAADFRSSARKSLVLTGELTRLVDLFERKGITVLPFKGPALAIAAYDNLALRSFDDLDLLVGRRDLWRARDLLIEAGYKESVPLGDRRGDALLDSYDELVMTGGNGLPMVELHWSFLPPHFSVPLDPAEFLARRATVSLGNRTIPSLCPEDLLLVLTLHGAKHCWSRLGFICDIAWLISEHQLDWKAVLDKAAGMRVVRMLLIAVALAGRIFGTPIPGPLEEPLRADRRAERLASRLARAPFTNPHDETAILPSALLHLRMRESARDRLRYITRLATRPGIEDWQAVDLPPRWSFLYPVLRLPRLARKYWARN